jgi:hypothetical protein
MNNKIINVTCKGSRAISLQELEAFQGNLVELKQENLEKLKRLLIKYGFRFPVFVWNTKIIDGHQRLFVLKHLIENEGYQFPHPIPVCDIEAESEKEAKELVLIARSEYGDTIDQGLYEFIETNNLPFPDLKDDIKLPGLDLEYFELNYYGQMDLNGVNIDELLYNKNKDTMDMTKLNEAIIKIRVNIQEFKKITDIMKRAGTTPEDVFFEGLKGYERDI